MISEILSTDGVQVLMRRANQNSAKSNKRKVAVYARVSTDLEEQATSLETQMDAFQVKIASRSDWELFAVYAEEGKSGTQAEKRPEFQRMITDCKNGKIDYILTKSISRFARNTMECLKYVRELKDIGVFVYFDKEKIDSANSASELLLSVLAAVAQEESRSISENVKWGMRKRFQEGRPKWTNTYGYEKNDNGEYQINEEQAEVVRFIFDRYANGASLPEIVKQLNDDGIPTYYGNKWWPKSAAEILKNEKYIGDIRMQKTYVTDHISHNKIKNDQTVLPGYYVNDHHEAIVSRKQYELVQTIAAMKDTHSGYTQYPYYGTLICPHCGRKMLRLSLNGHGKPVVWVCPNKMCNPQVIREKYIDRLVIQAFEELDENCLRKLDTEEANKALAWKVRLSELGSFFTRIEYIFLDAVVDSITFDGWDTGVISWKCGLTSRVKIEYDRISDIPDLEITVDGDSYLYNGKPLRNGCQIHAGQCGVKRDIMKFREKLSGQDTDTRPKVHSINAAPVMA